MIRDVATGRYVDRDRLHYIDFVGEFFSVKGPSITPRSPQAHPLVVVRDEPDALPVVARWADVVRVAAPDLAAAHTAREQVRAVGHRAPAATRRGRRAALDVDPAPTGIVDARSHGGVSAAGAADGVTAARRCPTPGPALARLAERGLRRAGRPGRHPAGAVRPAPPGQPTSRGPTSDRADQEADPPRRALPRRQQHHGVERPGVGQPDRLRLVRALRPDRRARPVRLPVPRRGPAAARAPRQDPRPRRRRPPGHAHRAERDRRGHRPTSASAARSTPRSTSRTSWPASSPRSTTSPAAGPRGTSSPAPTRSPARTSAAAASCKPEERYERAQEILDAAKALWLLRRASRSKFDERAVHLRGPLHAAADAAGPPGAHPVRRLRRGPRVRRPHRRRDLLPARHRRGGPGVLPGPQGPDAALRPQAGGDHDPARHHVRARRHRGRGPGERRAGAPGAGEPADRDRVPRAGVGPRPVGVRPGRPAARRRARRRARPITRGRVRHEKDPAGASPRRGASWPRPRAASRSAS